MKKSLLLLLAALLLVGCNQKIQEPAEPALMNITPEEAKKIMDTTTGYVILDVRTQEEYTEKHIPGAILVPDFEIAEQAANAMPDKNQMILVYCRSGRRSKEAAKQLEAMGYTCIREFGGIIDWPYETEAGK